MKTINKNCYSEAVFLKRLQKQCLEYPGLSDKHDMLAFG